ncbi:MAG: flagellar hook-length control protein FliK [Pseudomonadota bacterium]
MTALSLFASMTVPTANQGADAAAFLAAGTAPAASADGPFARLVALAQGTATGQGEGEDAAPPLAATFAPAPAVEATAMPDVSAWKGVSLMASLSLSPFKTGGDSPPLPGTLALNEGVKDAGGEIGAIEATLSLENLIPEASLALSGQQNSPALKVEVHAPLLPAEGTIPNSTQDDTLFVTPGGAAQALTAPLAPTDGGAVSTTGRQAQQPPSTATPDRVPAAALPLPAEQPASEARTAMEKSSALPGVETKAASDAPEQASSAATQIVPPIKEGPPSPATPVKESAPSPTTLAPEARGVAARAREEATAPTAKAANNTSGKEGDDVFKTGLARAIEAAAGKPMPSPARPVDALAPSASNAPSPAPAPLQAQALPPLPVGSAPPQAFSGQAVPANAGGGMPQASLSPPPSASDFAQTVGLEIARQATAKAERFTIRLDPPELGRIDIRLTLGEDKKVQAHMVLDSERTLDLLQRDVRGLERALETAGLKADSGQLQFSLKGQGDGRLTGGGGGAGGSLASEGELAEGEGEGPPLPPLPLKRIAAATVRPLDMTI